MAAITSTRSGRATAALWGVSRGHPSAIAFDGDNIWVTNYNSNTVISCRPATGNLGTSPSGPKFPRLAFDGANIWVANS